MPPTVSRRGRLARALIIALTAGLAIAVAGACGAGARPASVDLPPSSSPSVIRPPDPGSGELSTPDDRVLLTVTGRISPANAQSRLQLDQGDLDRLGLLEVNVYDPWVKQRITVQGTWLVDLIDLARPAPGASSLHLHALDDYQVDLSLADVRARKVFLATRTGEGVPIPIDQGGPTRVVFTDDVAAAFSADQWIWSIDTIDVR